MRIGFVEEHGSRRVEGVVRHTALFAFVLVSSACPTVIVVGPVHGDPDANAGDAGPAQHGDACAPCVSNSDCDGACVQIGGDDACAPSCSSDADCGSGAACVQLVSSDGSSASVCAPKSGSCAGDSAGCGTCPGASTCDIATGTCVVPASSTSDTPPPPPAQTCGTLIGPDAEAQCGACTQSGTQQCQPNGCYGGWWCDSSTSHCKPPPSSSDCTPPSSPPPPPPSTPPASGSVTPQGGTVSGLYFAVIGDTRPPSIDNTSHYPTQVIDSIYGDINSLSPKPLFVVTTGDSMFASSSGSEAQPQLALYAQAMHEFTGGPIFATMGNHECTGATTGNCTSTTNNMQAFMNTFMTPLAQPKPYYAVPFKASDASWSANMIVLACNAWSTAQKDFLTQELETSDTYHIVVRHEPLAVTNAPCSHDANAIIGSHKVDLVLAGHTHTFKHVGNEVVIGTGGAPMVDSTPPGYALVELTSSGFHVTQMDASSNGAVSDFTIPFAN